MGVQSASIEASKLRLRRQWLLVARASWTGALMLAAGLFAAGIPVIVPELRTACDGTSCYSWQLGARDVADLSQLNLYVACKIALEILVLGGFSLIATIIVVRRSEEPMALLAGFALVTFAASLSDVIRAFAVTSPVWYWPREILAFLGWSSLFLCFYLFPDGRFVPRWTRGAAAGWVLLVILHYATPPAWGISAASAAESRGAAGQSVFALGLIAFVGSVVIAQVHRYRHVSTQLQRQQTKWVVVGFAAMVVGFIVIVGWEPFFLSGLSAFTARLVTLVLISAVLLLLPFSLALAILRYRLWDIDLIINRALVYGGLSLAVVGLYVLVVGYLSALFHTSGNLAFSLVATALVAVLFQPLRERLQRSINHVMYGEQDDPYGVVSRLGQRLEGTLASDEVLPVVVETVTQALKLPFAAVTIEHAGASTVTAAAGTPTEHHLSLPLIYRGEKVGTLIVAPRAGEHSFSAVDRRLLEDLARQAGAAAHAVGLTAELQRSRERLVTAREEERRRLRRDLHDGLGPALSGIMLKINNARRLLESQSPAEPILKEVREDVQRSVSDIRRLVYDLRPPALDELGLVGAIRETALTCETDGRRVMVEAPDALPPLPAAVEVAAYRIVQEALTNAVRHAQCGTCTIRLSVSDGMEVDVTDDGVGLPEERRIGVGLTSIRERATELGGECIVERTADGGTRVRAHLPLDGG